MLLFYCRGGWMCRYSFICLSAGAVEWKPSGFAATLLHYAPPKVTLILVLFVIFAGFFSLIYREA